MVIFLFAQPQITGGKKQSELYRAALFAVRVIA
jgi:hypothetical protein